MSNAICFYDDSVKNLVNKKTNDPNLKVLIDHACVFDDNYENSFAWLVETPLMLHALAYHSSKGKIDDWGERFNEKLSSKNHKFDTVYTCDKSYLEFDCVKYMPAPAPSWISDEDANIHDKNKLISFITSNKTATPLQQHRVQLANKMIEENFGDVFGRGFGEIKNKVDGLKDYAFSIAIENTSTPGYHTEKILDCFRTGTIPIYIGDTHLEPFDARGVLRANDINEVVNYMNKVAVNGETIYRDMLPYVKNNYEAAMQYDNFSETIYDKILKDRNAGIKRCR